MMVRIFTRDAGGLLLKMALLRYLQQPRDHLLKKSDQCATPFSISVRYKSVYALYCESVPACSISQFFFMHEYFANSCFPSFLINIVAWNAASPFILHLSLDVSD